jgi:hypothetical protein
MVSVIYSRHLQSGDLQIEKVIDWAPFDMPEDRQEAVESYFFELSKRYSEEREVQCENVPNLFSFFQAHPEFAAKSQAPLESRPA